MAVGVVRFGQVDEVLLTARRVAVGVARFEQVDDGRGLQDVSLSGWLDSDRLVRTRGLHTQVAECCLWSTTAHLIPLRAGRLSPTFL